MALKRLDNLGIAVESLDIAIAFFSELGLTLEGRTTVTDSWAGSAAPRAFALAWPKN